MFTTAIYEAESEMPPFIFGIYFNGKLNMICVVF
jgi:hypothetical protein